MSIIMGTAGHIDHGKTTLIKALSGIDCDRLKDEKKRGITIELGFAHLDLGGSERLGIIDVPGHEKFVKNMVAGAAGIDFVLLTVAADEGIMPQTREHIEICSLLGIKEGLVAITKTDMVDPDLLELAAEEVADFLSGTFLEGAGIYPVSSHTGEGIPELLAAIKDKVAGLTVSHGSDLFRLPIDRVFTMRGYGTVITGTLVSGSISTAETVRIYPGEKKSKVRGLQVHGQSVEKALSGQRTAMNLTGLEVGDIERGQCLARPGTLFPWNLWDVELNCLPTAPKPLKHRKEIHFHHGSREVLARVYLLDRDQLEPGESCPAQIRFPLPMVGCYGDRFVLRSFSPLRTIGGGTLVNPLGRKIKRFSEQVRIIRDLNKSDLNRIIQSQLELAGLQGLDLPRLQVLTGQPLKKIVKALQELGSARETFLFDREEQRYVSGTVVRELTRSLLEHVREYHQKNPMKSGMSKGMLFSGWGKDIPAKLVHFVLERGLKSGDLAVDNDSIRLPEHTISMATDQTKIKEEIHKIYLQAGLQPPNLNTVLEELGTSKKEALPVLELLINEGSLVRLGDNLYFSSRAVERIREMVRSYFAEHEDMSPTDFKELTGLSRKYSIPLLEYLDKQKMTMRIGDVRKLRQSR
ncbi:MAG: selenocysteine-specific translation elongation factor [Desulfohalobiaceae bacterium]|nr:selenocysteine-specific translation elongation factor [Desulfohalobiaceae bacterium]